MSKLHLKRILVEGYKSIKKLQLEMLPVNILIGANGAGKSNFISLFTFLSQLSKGKLRTYVEQNGFADSFFHFGTKNSKRITLELDVSDNSYHVDFIHGSNDDNLVFENEYCTFNRSHKKFTINGVMGESGLLPSGKAKSDYVRDYTRKYLEQCRVYHFHDTSISADFKKAVDLQANDYLYHNAGNLAAFLFRLKEEFPSNYKNIVSCIRAVAPFFHDFLLEPRGKLGDQKILLKWIHRNHNDPFSANQLSDGTARFICMATLFLQPVQLSPYTIILDEPELGLHPAALDILSELIFSVSGERQVICSTQSVTFANHFKPEDFIVVDQAQGVSHFKRLNKDELSLWLEDYKMGEIWTKNLIGGRPEW